MPPVHSSPATPQKPRKRTKEGSQPYPDTPICAKLQGEVEIVNSLVEKEARPSNRAIFDYFDVASPTARRWLSEPAQTRGNRGDLDPCGGSNKMSTEGIEAAKALVDNEDVAGKSLTWGALGHKIWPKNPPRGQSLQRRMKLEGYCKFKAALRASVDEPTRKNRVEYAKIMLSKYPKPWDWANVLYSDETHCNYKGQGPMNIIRRLGTRQHYSNVQEKSEDHGDLHKPRVHFWAAIGFNFKSPLIRYDIASNTNGKMTKADYIRQILDPYVRHWFGKGRDFVLEEDGDSGHGAAKGGDEVSCYKALHGIKTYQNCPKSPDLVCIENSWQGMKFQLCETGHWDDDDTVEIAWEYWKRLFQHKINRWALSTPMRLRKVIEANGHLISDSIMSTQEYLYLLEEKGLDYDEISRYAEASDSE